MSSRLCFALSIPALVFLAAPAARADRRAFAHTYEYVTMPRGGLELEFYNTQTRPSFDSDVQKLGFQIEIEYGITDHWDVSLYQVFDQASGNVDPALNEGLHYSKTKLRTRYRFAERGEWPVDVLGYFEIARPFAKDELELEPKLILARDFGKLTAAVNLIGVVELGEETEFIPEWAAGLTYEAAPQIKLGGETFGELAPEGDERELEAWVGPSVSWAPSPKIWIVANAGFGLTEASSDFVARAIIGIGL